MLCVPRIALPLLGCLTAALSTRACCGLMIFASFSDAGDGDMTRARRVDRRAGVRRCRPACQPDGLWPRHGPHGLLALFAAAASWRCLRPRRRWTVATSRMRVNVLLRFWANPNRGGYGSGVDFSKSYLHNHEHTTVCGMAGIVQKRMRYLQYPLMKPANVTDASQASHARTVNQSRLDKRESSSSPLS